MPYTPRYSGPNRSGICVCGHSWESHHLGMVMNLEYYEQTKEPYLPQECEVFGFNELGGLDADGEPHCFGYVDSLYIEQPKEKGNQNSEIPSQSS